MAPFRTLWSLLKLSQALLLLEFLAWLFIALGAPPLVSFYFSLSGLSADWQQHPVSLLVCCVLGNRNTHLVGIYINRINRPGGGEGLRVLPEDAAST